MTQDQAGPTFDRPIVEVTISAPIEEVWRSLREPDRILQWFGWDADSLPAEVDYIFIEHAQADDAAQVIRFRGMNDRFELHARGEATLLRVVRPAPSADADWDEVFQDETQGWIAFVQQLRFALERHSGQPRRTIFLSGVPLDPAAPRAQEALGLTAAPDQPYAVTGPGGEPLAGQVWHRGRHQLGVTVDGWGDGLLVLLERRPDAAKPSGAASATLTTYGLDDPAFAALESRWTAWWAERFESKPPSCD